MIEMKIIATVLLASVVVFPVLGGFIGHYAGQADFGRDARIVARAKRRLRVTLAVTAALFLAAVAMGIAAVWIAAP